MDWQHLIMNGENLAEYAALLAAEGLLGHQHANSGWGTFDDDNMVGATAFMETLELALELRRAGYGENGERLGFDLYPYTEDAVGAVKRVGAAVALHRRRRGADRRAPRCARRSTRKDAVARLRARVRRARRVTRAARRPRRRHDRRQGGRDLAGRRGARDAPRRRYPLSTPQPGLGRAGSRGLVACRARRRSPRSAAERARSGSPARCTGSSCSTTTTACCGRRSSGTTSARRPSAPRSSGASGSSG